MRRVNIPLLLLFLGAAASARANDFMFSEATAPVVFPLMLLWVVVGLLGAIVLIGRGIRLDHVGAGAFICVGIFVLLDAKVEGVAIFWMIYLALSTVYYTFPRANIPPAERRANLAYHGTFLALVIVGGIVAKVVYWSGMGGYSRWLESMEDFYLPCLVFFGVFTVAALAWFRRTTARRARRLAAERSAPSSDAGPS